MSTAFEAGQLGALGRGNRAYSFKNTCGVVPKELDEYRKLKSGQTITGNICFSVRRADVRALVLVYESLFSATNTRVLFALR